MTQKERQVFALKNFRGLDKENKLLKVENYRASDGYNFIIDSETLKTRPSFTLNHNPNFFLEAGEYLIDWHTFGIMYVYITNKHIRIFNGVNVLDETSAIGTISNNNIIRPSFLNTFNFAGLKPFFQEEKECLFIYGLGDIYVVSNIDIPSTPTFTIPVLYPLNNKPSNPFTPNSDGFILFNALPTAYVPTIWLGDKVFEDVNLLSNQSRYKLFANQTSAAGSITYNLPTYYDANKHGNFSSSNIGVSFYKDKYDGFPAQPVFMGVHNEDWFGIINGSGVITAANNWGSELPSFAGTILNTANPIVIENTFYPEQTFEYTNHNPEQIIYEEYALTKDKFFEMIVKNSSNQTVFEYLMSYISTNKNTIGLAATGWTENKVLVFIIRAQYEAILRDNQDRDIIKKEIRWKDFLVYVQIRKYETKVSKTAQSTVFAETITTNLGDAYENYIEPTQAQGANIFEIVTPIQVQNFTPYTNETQSGIQEVDEIVNSYLSTKTLLNNNYYAVKLRLYETFLINATTRSIFFPTQIEQNVLEIAQTTWSGQLGNITYPNEPDFDNNESYSVKSLGDIVASGNGAFTFTVGSSERTLMNTLITSYINSNQASIDGFNKNLGYGIFKARIRRENADVLETGEQPITFYYVGYVVVKVSISPALIVQEKRRSITYQTQVFILNNWVGIPTNLYSINLKENNSLIELKVKDYFYDYKNEPAIEVMVTYQQNTDYNIVAKSKFGITFGSENRVFLAGNSDFPNIDRFNVSNDLLGDNVDNQSYELSYFPSKNYRVLGGKGAINGYVIATDNQLYVTKENYPNDSKLFIRQRNVDNQGQVSYIEYKTNITKTPLNNRCLVRFYNDILVLSKDGLYGIEISQNVLTDERLVKLRSGYINKELVKAIANYDNSKIFIVENNIYMYIFIGGIAYVADSRYISQNANSAAENVSYELIEWKNNFIDTSTPMQSFISAKVINDVVYFIEENNNFIYTLQDFNADDLATKDSNEFTLTDFQEANQGQFKVFQISSTLYNQIATSAANASKYVFKFIQTNQAYIHKAVSPTDYTTVSSTVTIVNPSAFSNVTEGSKLYFRDVYTAPYTTYLEFTVSNLTSQGFTRTNQQNGQFNNLVMYQRVTNTDLYITIMYQYNGQYFIRLSNLKPDTVVIHSAGTSLTTIRTNASFGGLYNNITFSSTTVVYGALIIKKNPIKLRWVSGITDFGNSQMEKTSFRMNIYATKKELTNTVTFGYRTMRRLAGFTSPIDLSNNFNFNEVNFNNYNLASFDTTAVSLPMKENNFLYIQFILDGNGKIEMNSIEVIYKNNRMLKSVG
jgi:hypothetical protein